MRRRGLGMPLVGGAAVVLVVVGLLLFRSGATANFGWYAYSPLSDRAPFPVGAVLWTRQAAVGAGLLVLGLLAAAGLVGYRLGRRAAAPRH